ncbi:Eukaryotic translation initiation factor 3 subunit G [Geodia barretti]|uniref:Eukaryotic translation initiation factor 3 subunit G n=1 Tax=Geodia barretti TaxID=519541 RepID=A0AA35XEK1_GEOBA|nr:Eukaryotic translation initiation factor 3 subunit G [Geodia barretti]
MPIPQTPASATPQGAGQSVSWADQMDDLEASVITADNLPEPRETVSGDTRTMVSYRVDEGGKIKKVTQVYKEVRQQVPKAIAKRRTWKKFGDAEQDNPKGPDQATTVIADDVYLTLTTNREQLEHHDDDPLKKLSTKSMVTCRICKGDHWTTKCPYKDTLGSVPEMEEVNSKPVTAAGVAAGGTGAVGPATGKYIPPSQRGDKKPGERGESFGSRMQQDDQATVRVTNLSEETQESDLRELFGYFGQIKRVFLAKDKITQQSKGFAFISYELKDYAQKAIDALDGYGYDHLILKVEWAKPSKVQH